VSSVAGRTTMRLSVATRATARSVKGKTVMSG
jgi:hypothetical protein